MLINSNKYLYLKQLIILLRASRLGKEVTIDDNDVVSKETLERNIVNLCNSIKQDFTIPSVMLRTDRSPVKLEDISCQMGQLLKMSDDDIKEITDVIIYDNPKLDLLYERLKSEWKEKNSYWIDIRHDVASIMDSVASGLDIIMSFAQNPETKLQPYELIIIVNMIHSIEFIFELCEQQEGAFEDKELPLTMVIEE